MHRRAHLVPGALVGVALSGPLGCDDWVYGEDPLDAAPSDDIHWMTDAELATYGVSTFGEG